MISVKKRVLITGINGFTGRYMAAEMFAAGYHVFGIGINESNEPDYIQVDLADLDAVKNAIMQIQPQIVIHLAAQAFIGNDDANAFYRVNLLGTRNLLEALSFCTSSLDAVLLASSANIYGNRSEGMLNELVKPEPVNDYAVSKLAMEYCARLWMDKLPLIITRPFNYTGVGQTEQFLLPKVVLHFRQKMPEIELGNLDVWRDFSDVRALVQAYRRLIEVKAIGQAVNVCSGEIYSLREIVEMCEEITGHKLNIRVNPAFVRKNEVKTLCGDASRLKELIGDWKTPPLQETLQWMLIS